MADQLNYFRAVYIAKLRTHGHIGAVLAARHYVQVWIENYANGQCEPPTPGTP